jgi:hypothetical protein
MRLFQPRCPAFRGVPAALYGALTLTACTGLVESVSGPGSDFTQTGDSPIGTDPDGNRCDPEAKSFAPARLWQLTDEQYVNVVRDVFGVTLEGDDAHIVSAAVSDHYTNYSEGIAIGLQVAPSYQVAAQKVAARVVADAESVVGSAAPSTSELRSFLHGKVARAFRRPLEEAEIDRLVALYELGLPDASTGLGLVMQAVLQAPSFLYRSELGTHAADESGPVQLTPHEIASALGFLMLESVPDDLLWQSAEDGSLAEPEVLSAHVDRLMATPEVRRILTKKASYWLGLESLPGKIKDQELFPEFTSTLRQSLHGSVQAFLVDTLWTGTVADLFGSSKVYANAELAATYALGNVEGDELRALDIPERSAGILTQPGFLAAANKWADRGDPIHRGLYVYHAFICGAVLPPPADAFDVGGKLDGTEREKVEKRARMDRCAGCHALFDPIGLTFERFDAIGRLSDHAYTEFDPVTGVTSWKESEAAIDDSAMVSVALGEPFAGPMKGLDDLAAALASAQDRVASCAAKQLVEYSLGYNPDAQNSCELAAIKHRFAESGSFAEFFRDVMTSPAFVTRDPTPK